MANLIITVIAIALVAVASLMGAYYGGSAFLNNQSAANASTVMNIGQQIAGAWQAFLSDHYNSSPTAWTDLTNGGYLASVPTHPAVAGGISATQVSTLLDAQGNSWLWIPVGRPSAGAPANDPNSAACVKILKTALGTPSVPSSQPATHATFVNPLYGNGTFGCIQWNGAATLNGGLYNTADWALNDWVMFYRVQ